MSRAAELPKGFLPCIGWVDAEFGSPLEPQVVLKARWKLQGQLGIRGDKRSAREGAALFHLFFLKPDDGCEVSAQHSLGGILVGLWVSPCTQLCCQCWEWWCPCLSFPGQRELTELRVLLVRAAPGSHHARTA